MVQLTRGASRSCRWEDDGGLGAEPLAGSRGTASGGGSGREAPRKLNIFAYSWQSIFYNFGPEKVSRPAALTCIHSVIVSPVSAPATNNRIKRAQQQWNRKQSHEQKSSYESSTRISYNELQGNMNEWWIRHKQNAQREYDTVSSLRLVSPGN